MPDSNSYHIEGVMTNMAGGWLLALDRPFEGGEGDTLTVDGSVPPVTVSVVSVVASDDGATRDIVIAPLHDLHDPRFLTGRGLRAA